MAMDSQYLHYNMLLSNLVHLNIWSETPYSYVQWKQLKQEIANGISITVQDGQLHMTYMLFSVINHFKFKIMCVDGTHTQHKGLPSKTLYFDQPYGCFYLLRASSSIRKELHLDTLPINDVIIKVPQTLIVNLTFLDFNTLYIECKCCRSSLQIHGLWPSKESATIMCKSGDPPLISPYLLSKINIVGLTPVGRFTASDTILVSFSSRAPVNLMHIMILIVHSFFFYNYKFLIEKEMIKQEVIFAKLVKPRLSLVDSTYSGWWIRFTLVSYCKCTFKLQLKHGLLQQVVFDGPGSLSPELNPTMNDRKEASYSSSFNAFMLLEIADLSIGRHVYDDSFKAFEHYGRLDNTPHCLPMHMDAKKVYHLEAGQSLHISTVAYGPGDVGVYCAWIFTTPTHTYPQIDIHQWQYKGTTDQNCSYGGLTIRSHTQRNYKSDIHLCGKMSEAAPITNFTIYSEQNKMHVEVIFYNPYSRGKLEATISVSRGCKVTTNECHWAGYEQSYKMIESDTVNQINYFWEMKDFTQGDYKCLIIQEFKRPVQIQIYHCLIVFEAMHFDASLMVKRAYYTISCTTKSHKLVNSSEQNRCLYITLKDGYTSIDRFKSADETSITFGSMSYLQIMEHFNLSIQMPIIINIKNISTETQEPDKHKNNRTLISRLLYNEALQEPLYKSLFALIYQDINKMFHKLEISLWRINDQWTVFSNHFLLTFVILYAGTCPKECSLDTIQIVGQSYKVPTLRTHSGRIWILPLMSFQRKNNQVLKPSIAFIYDRKPNPLQLCDKTKCKIILMAGISGMITFENCIPIGAAKIVPMHGVYTNSVLDKCIYVVDVKLQTWYEARQECNDLGGDLLTLNHVHKNFPVMESLKHSLWVDLEKKGKSSDTILPYILLHHNFYIGFQTSITGIRWINGKPLTHHSEWTLPPNGFNLFLNMASNSSQNIINSSTMEPNIKHRLQDNCCGLVSNLLPGYQSNWKLIHCNQTNLAGYICEVPKHIDTILETENNNELNISDWSLATTRLACMSGWLQYNVNDCFYLLKTNNSSCSKIGVTHRRELGNIEYRLLYVIVFIYMGDQCFFNSHVTFQDTWDDDIFLQYALILRSKEKQLFQAELNRYLKKDHIGNCTEKGWILCQMNSTESLVTKSLLPLFFQCKSGEYVLQEYRCDLVYDCVSQDDETECTNICSYRLDKQTGDGNCMQCHQTICSCHTSYFQCHGGGCIDIGKVCDYTYNCADGSDESGCVFMPCLSGEYSCDDMMCISDKAVCNGIIDCFDGGDEQNCLKECEGYLCSSGECIDQYKENNFIPDCEWYDDEREYLLIAGDAHFSNNNTCPSGTLPCLPGHSTCFNMNELCIYDTMPDWSISFCGNGAHLKYCTLINCPFGTFKCQHSYCIPIRKVCDGIIDCIIGDDERACPLTHCPPRFYKCKGEMRCLSIQEMCDGHIHCPLHKDDEKACIIPTTLCPTNCTCAKDIIDCYQADRKNIVDLTTSSLVSISWRRNITKLKIINCGLQSFTVVARHLIFLRHADLVHNSLSSFSFLKETSVKHIFLYFLDISYNFVTFLSSNTFQDMYNLRVLNISNNEIVSLSFDIFEYIIYLESFDVSGPQLEEITFEYNTKTIVEERTYVSSLILEKKSLCCMAKSVLYCDEEPLSHYLVNPICQDIIPYKYQRLLFRLSGSIVCCVSIMTYFVLFQSKIKFGKNFQKWDTGNLLQLNLVFSDSLHGPYLLGIAVADYIYRGVFPVQRAWLKTHFCFCLKVISTFGPLQSCIIAFIMGIHFSKSLKMKISKRIDHLVNALVFVTFIINLLLLIQFVAYEDDLRDFKDIVEEGIGLCNLNKSFTSKRLLSTMLPSIIFVVWHAISITGNIISHVKVSRLLRKSRLASGRVSLSNTEIMTTRISISLISFRISYFCSLLLVSTVGNGPAFIVGLEMIKAFNVIFNSFIFIFQKSSLQNASKKVIQSDCISVTD